MDIITSITEVKHRLLWIVFVWGCGGGGGGGDGQIISTRATVYHMASISNGFGICYMLNVCMCMFIVPLYQPSRRNPDYPLGCA